MALPYGPTQTLIGRLVPPRRNFDEVTNERLETVFGGLWIRKVEGKGGTGWEIKSGNAELSDNQKKVAAAHEANGKVSFSAALSEAGKNAGHVLPVIGREVRNARVSLDQIPADVMKTELVARMQKAKLPPHLIQEMSASLDNFYELQKTAKLQGNIDLYGKITVGAVVTALAAGMAADALFGDE